MQIEFTGEASYTKYHYGEIKIESGDDQGYDISYDFTLIENYDSNPDSFQYEIAWPDGPPHNWKNLESRIIEEFQKQHV